MATLRFTRCIRSTGVSLSLGISLLALLSAAGCQPARPIAVAHLPPPSFNGPRILPRSSTATNAHPGIVPATPSGPSDWTPRVPPRPWRWIIVHHSASESGSMAVFDKEHRAKGWDGVGYHFVIGNGSNSRDGQIEVTPRWPIQKWGAHAKTLDNRFNEYGIGICLVGNFDVERPTPAQVKSLTRLVAYLMQTYHVPAQNVLGHRDTKPTDCPGRFVNVAALRQLATQAIVDAHGRVEPDRTQTAAAPAAPGELLGEIAPR